MNNNILLNTPNIHFESHRAITSDSPFIIHPRVAVCKNAFSLHKNIELLYFLDGEGQMLYDSTPLCLQKGDIVAVNSYSLHQIPSAPQLPHFCVIISSDFCLYHGIDPAKLVFHRLVRGDGQADKLFRQLVDTYADETTPLRSTRIKSAVLALLLHLCLYYSTPTEEDRLTRNPNVEHICRAVDFMKANLNRKLTVDEIAAVAGLSTFHFLREFKHLTGHTLVQYLNTLRCDHARNLLESGRYSVKEVAFLCGFSNNSYFSSVFRRHTGLLPSQLQIK